MRILHFYKSYYPDEFGGVARFIRQLAEGGRALGLEAEILVLTSGKPGLLEMGGIKVHRVKRLFRAASTDFSLSVLGEFKRLARAADLVHYHYPYPLADLVHFWAGHKKPSLVTYHSDIVAQRRLFYFYRPLMARFLASVPAIVASSPNYIESSPVLRGLAAKTRCIPFGLEPAAEPAAELVENWRRRLPERFFLFIGGFRYYKGLDFLLEAAKGAPWPLVLLGGGGLEAELKEKAAGASGVIFLGALPDEDKEAVLRLCYGLVLPSHLRSEAFGLVLLEGAQRGKPLVCCEIGSGMSYINIHGETGLTVPPGDAAALGAALSGLWADPERAEALGAGARRRYEELFSGEKMVAAYAALYRELARAYASN